MAGAAEPVRASAGPLAPAWLAEEADFYGRYGWCLDVFPTFAEAGQRLQAELAALGEAPPDWRGDEVLCNVFLLSCALADSADDHLAGDGWDFSRAAAVLPLLDRPARLAVSLNAAARRLRWHVRRGERRWREAWGTAVRRFLESSLAADRPDAGGLRAARAELRALLQVSLPASLLGRRISVPAAFRSQDLTHHDVLELAARFIDAFPERRRPLLVVGLRTAGSYLAPLVQAALSGRGYEDVDRVTLRPKRGFAPWERRLVDRTARRGATAVLVDEAPDTGATLAATVDWLRRSGFPRERIAVLVPIHPSRGDWMTEYPSLPLAGTRILTLEPADWHKQRHLTGAGVEARVRAYYLGRGYAGCRVLAPTEATALNSRLEALSEHKFHTRLKRVFTVELRTRGGRVETRHVLAKSVGWGWLGYHAFWSGDALHEFVPPLLGLRDGILYSEWLREGTPLLIDRDRPQVVGRLASYVAARVRTLGLGRDPVPRLSPQHQKGLGLVAAALSGAWGSKVAAALVVGRLRRKLAGRVCPVPTLIDGKMRVLEWVRSGPHLLKTDFEQHGLGKTELNVCDPAYDLAEAILHFRLSPEEEEALLRRYEEESGDRGVRKRLLCQKLLAGTAAAVSARDNLRDPRLHDRRQEFDRSYREALEFLTVQAARACGALCRPSAPPTWRAPVVVLDVDGVLDKLFFPFPATTASGIEALRVFHAHGMTMALNTARPLAEVREYCRAYGMVGGVAEHGAVAWDAQTDRVRVLVDRPARDEMGRLAEALREVPGVFLNDRNELSLRAYAYEGGRTAPLPDGLVQGLIAELGLGRLTVRRTYLDTTVVASEADKGRGMVALLELAGLSPADAIAIGDSEPDLAMFGAAARSFAPSHASGRAVARQLGCEIAAFPFQRGLLSAARAIVHPGGGRCPRCPSPRWRAGLLWQVLRAADRGKVESLCRALLDPRSLEAFRR